LNVDKTFTTHALCNNASKTEIMFTDQEKKEGGTPMQDTPSVAVSIGCSLVSEGRLDAELEHKGVQCLWEAKAYGKK
jgi:hypothetical protein